MPKTTKKPYMKKESSIVDEKTHCLICGNVRQIDFYNSYSDGHIYNQKMPWCKSCIEALYLKYFAHYNDGRLAMYYLCRKLDTFYANPIYEGAKNNSAKTNVSVVSSYFKILNSFRNTNRYGNCFDESWDFIDESVAKNNTIKNNVVDIQLPEQDMQNKKDVIRLIKYDPFVDEANDIKGFLYNKLIDFLDNDTLQDSFKLPIVIEMVKGFGQAERINRALSLIDVVNDTSRIDDIKKLSDTKQNILKSILAMAKDNGISENYSNNKSKGAGTLSGLIKELQDKGVHASDVNLYDIETCEGMKQVADISNRSILEQLMLNENDYVDMIKDQKALIQELDEKSCKFEEENRILKVKIKEIENTLKQQIPKDGE